MTLHFIYGGKYQRAVSCAISRGTFVAFWTLKIRCSISKKNNPSICAKFVKKQKNLKLPQYYTSNIAIIFNIRHSRTLPVPEQLNVKTIETKAIQYFLDYPYPVLSGIRLSVQRVRKCMTQP